MKRIPVIGLDGGPLSGANVALVREADLVVGGKARLSSLGVEPSRSVALEGDLSGSMERIEKADGSVAVLASGDPGFFGITRVLAERFGPGTLDVRPAPSSVSLAFGRAGLSWEDAVVVSAHGSPDDADREPRRAVNVCRAYPKVAVLTRPGFGPAELVRELAGPGRDFIVCERLGSPEERVFRGDAGDVADGDWRDPNVVIVLDKERLPGGKSWMSGGARGPGRWGLPEDEFEHRSGMVTKSEVRAVALSRLGPGPGDLVWDVGAGSGSVAVECARFGAAAVAVERDPESCERIRRNSARHGVRVEVVEGEAPVALEGLPEPDAVFVGGGGSEETVGLCAERARRSVVLALVTLERVLPASRALEEAGFSVETTLLQASRVKGIGSLNRLVPESPVFVVSGERP